MPKTEAGEKYRKRYSEENLSNALKAIENGMPKKEASRVFNIPRSTLQFRKSDKFVKARHGPSTVLTAQEENTLVQWIKECHQKGFPRRKEDIQISVKQFLDSEGRPTVFPDNKPGDGWYKSFMLRHPEISVRKSEGVTQASSKVSEADIKKWFKSIHTYLEKKNFLDVLNDPNRIFNADETNFMICPQTKRVLAPKGSRNVYEIDTGPAKASITVLFSFSASGLTAPPLIVYPYKRMPKDILSSVPEEFSVAYSDSGWMKTEIFFEYIGNTFCNFVRSKGIKFPILLFVDGHKTHLDRKLTELCQRLNIILVALYPNSTRILQPADVSAFKPLKDGWRRGVLQWRRTHPTENLDKKHFASLLKTVIEDSVKPQIIINGFRACGLYPWNPDAIDYSKCLGGTTNKPLNTDKSKKEITLSYQDFKNLVGPERMKKFKQLKENLEENTDFLILYNLWLAFQNNESEANQTETEQALQQQEIDKNEANYAAQNHSDDKIVKVGDIVNIQDINIMETPAVIENNGVLEIIQTDTQGTGTSNIDTAQCISILSLSNATLNLEDHLYCPETPVRKGKKQVERLPFVLSSSTYKEIQEKKEMEKLNVSMEKEKKKTEREAKKIKAEEEKKLKVKKRKQSNRENTNIKKEKSKKFIGEKFINNDVNTTQNEVDTGDFLLEVMNDLNKLNNLENSSINSTVHVKRNLTTEMFEIASKSVVPLETVAQNFTNTRLFEGICYSCTNNLTRNNVGLRCTQCIRTYHFKCIEKNELHKSNSNTFTCLTCLKKNR